MPPLGKPTNFGKRPHTYAEKKAERELVEREREQLRAVIVATDNPDPYPIMPPVRRHAPNH